jgi:hypothetical protein
VLRLRKGELVRSRRAGRGTRLLPLTHRHDPARQELLYMRQAGTPEVIYDGDGNIVDSTTLQYVRKPSAAELNCGFHGLAADVWGDSRDEIILFGARGACIFANARPLGLPTLYNETLYPGV